jgi:dipeptidyl-peptidase-4
VDSGKEWRLTEGSNDTLRHGEAEFVAQEEMDRFSGYWWSPDSRSIAYQETDLSPVEEIHILDPAHPEREPDTWRYPRPGKNNAVVRLGIIPAAGGKTTWVTWGRSRYPYLATVRWKRNAPLTILVQNRRQTEEALLAVDPARGATRTLLVERDPAWLNLDQKMPRWTEDGHAFLWTTERGGSWQLELHSGDGKLLRTLTSPDLRMRGFVDLDESSSHVWIEGGEDPTQIHLFRIPLGARGGPPEQMSREPGLNAAVFGENHRVWVRVNRGAEREPTYEVIDKNGETIGALRSIAERPRIRTHLSFETVGARKLRAVVVRPDDFRSGERYPVIVSVYGGPHSQRVTRYGQGYLIEQWLADHGYVVVSIDGRGTPGRGRAWERAIRNNLIEIPLADQVEGLRALGERHPEMDLSRVGIYGWSFGGYFSAMAAMRRPEVFRAAVAGAPVVDWRDYDTHYTERYMDLPQANARGYEAASVLTYAKRLERPLLIVHGTVDDNVYFLHSMKLCDALFRSGKSFEFLPLAGFTHMVPEPLVTARLYHRIEGFFEAHLGRGEGERAPSASLRDPAPAASRRPAPRRRR